MPKADTDATPAPLTSPKVRDDLVEALNLDLIGPWSTHALAEERLPRRPLPSNWYLAGFLVPSGTSPDLRADLDEDDDFDETPPEDGSVAESTEEGRPAKKSFFPSSVGLSFLVPKGADSISVIARWGDYERAKGEDSKGDLVDVWQRRNREQAMSAPLPKESATIPIPESNGLYLYVARKEIAASNPEVLLPGTQSVSVFMVNHRKVDKDDPDSTYAFQVGIEVRGDRPFVPRPNMRGTRAGDWDEDLADLHYADTPEYATGHGVSAGWELTEAEGGKEECRKLWTRWIPSATVEKTETPTAEGTVAEMDKLGTLADGKAAKEALDPLVERYRAWIEGQRSRLDSQQVEKRRDTAAQLLVQADAAAKRIKQGIDFLANDADVLDAFRVANRAVAAALRQRLDDQEPGWRAFQLAFILLNIPGIADPGNKEREHVDLLFFPTGGGKTEAYLGLAAFTMVLRRLRHPDRDTDPGGTGVAVIMRYTLRLLTLDQLSRASGLVCALELEREESPERYGRWPFEIGLWVGKAATPNHLGRKGDKRSDTALAKIRRFKSDPKGNPSPIPLESCPWCGTKFTPDSFDLLPDFDHPTGMRIVCADYRCDFSRDRALPIQAVDETIYRRLPAFLIATVDKFAALPWTAETGKLLGCADRHDDDGFYGATEPRKGRNLGSAMLPPDLVIQDELHLISGPLGTMVGLYETAIDALCERKSDGNVIRPKIIASTATARKAQDQIQALFARPVTHVFPPPGPDRHDSFFAKVVPTTKTPGRQYVGIVAPGRSAKVLFRRVWLALMGAAQKAYLDAGGHGNKDNPADPYMTVLGYFNNLRELGGARRVLEEQVQNTAKQYGTRIRVGQQRGLFADRKKFSEVMELTGRVHMSQVASARQRLGCPYHDEKERVDCAIATNMISVGLDISRLGLMVVMGQPKMHAEYIQATSRVGRDDTRPGLVVTLLSVHKPRDRSHYERFRHYHETFYRSVEVSSVTPFSARALDRGFAGALVGLARHSVPALTPPKGVEALEGARPRLDERLREVFRKRAQHQSFKLGELDERVQSLHDRVGDLLDSWLRVVGDYHGHNVPVLYQMHEHANARGKPLLREMLEQMFESEHHRKFRVNRSMRNVEPDVDLFLTELTGNDVRP